MKKILLLGVIALLLVMSYQLNVQQWLSLDGLKAGLDDFLQWQAQSPVAFALIYFLLYVLVTALSLPGAAVLTIAAGALFGLTTGVILVSFASSIGATLAFLTARYLLRDWVQARYDKRLASINEGIRSEGAFYLFTLRLVPLFPFFLINLLMGLTPMRAITFYWVSQVGMLAGTAVYVNAGTQLASISSLSGILSLPLLLSFTALGLFPLLTKFVVARWRGARHYKGYKKPSSFDRNLIVIGAGAGGLVTSYIAALVKAKVTLIESHAMGGDCLNTGCVPSKALIKSARVAAQMRHGDKFGLQSAAAHFSFPLLMQRVRDIITAIEPHDSPERYTKLGVEVLQGRARLLDPWRVAIVLADGSERILSSRSIVIATGAEPSIADIPGLPESTHVTSDTLWAHLETLPQMPASLLVMGGGPVGCELAQCFAQLGGRVTLVEKHPRLLRREDPEVSEVARRALEAAGVVVLTEHDAVACGRDEQGEYLSVQHDGTDQRLPFDLLLCAIGRKPRVAGFGLEELGLLQDGQLKTNAFLETRLPNILAVGDVVGEVPLTHLAAHQAWYGAVNALFGTFRRFKVDYRVVPRVTFLDPEIAVVGHAEQSATAANIPFEVTRYGIDDLDRAITDSEAHGFIKVLSPPGSDKILGVTIVATHAGEMLPEFVLAMKHGLGLKKILGTIHAYPGWAEANKFAAGEWSKRHTPTGLLAWVERYHQWRRG